MTGRGAPGGPSRPPKRDVPQPPGPSVPQLPPRHVPEEEDSEGEEYTEIPENKTTNLFNRATQSRPSVTAPSKQEKRPLPPPPPTDEENYEVSIN